MSRVTVRYSDGFKRVPGETSEDNRAFFVMSFADRRDLGGAFWHVIQEGAETRARIAGLDVLLVGFDDLQGVNTIPRLTSVSHRLDDLGAAAVEIALRMVDHPEQMPNLRGSVKTLTARLVVGKSTGKRTIPAKSQPK